jgi:hypothetical protein
MQRCLVVNNLLLNITHHMASNNRVIIEIRTGGSKKKVTTAYMKRNICLYLD